MTVARANSIWIWLRPIASDESESPPAGVLAPNILLLPPLRTEQRAEHRQDGSEPPSPSF